jgi:dolichol-phosphate mannosyltransferase
MKPIIAVVIPCYKVKRHISQVIQGIGEEVSIIVLIDDCCPEETGNYISKFEFDPRITVIYHDINQGVGGAVISGYKKAIDAGAEIVVKIDGDGQMDTSMISVFVKPIVNGLADYTKGNRFYNLEEIRQMPKMRLFGNAVLSLITKLSSGYWNIFDPTNGFTAIHAEIIRLLPLDKISKRYFFESDMLFRLNTLRAVVQDIPISARYGDETSNLKIRIILGEFIYKHIRNFFKRIFYNYYLRDMSIASLQLPLGILLLVAGGLYGILHWIQSARIGDTTPAGTVMAAALPLIFGLQLLLSFLSFDIAAVPSKVLHVLRKK